MAALTKKHQRTLNFAAKRLFTAKGIHVRKSLYDVPAEKYFERELRLTENRQVFLTDYGYEHFCNVVNVIDKSDFFDGLAGYSDIFAAWRKVVEKAFSDGIAPESSEEIVQAIAGLVNQEIADYSFVVPIFGVDLDGVDSFSFGALTILRLSTDVMEAAGVKHESRDVTRILEMNKNRLWMKGKTHGTKQIAQQKFSEQAALAAGMLAITAASMYEWGAHGFRIGFVMTPEDAPGRSAWFSWHETERILTTHFVFPRGQPLEVNVALGDESDLVRIIHRALDILQTVKRTELEEAIARAVYWYSDAHRDPIHIMRLVKYWSCVEAFFSFDGEEITHAVSSGLASILVFGDFRFVEPSEYGAVKKQIANLYSIRSRAVHHGSHQNISERDVGQFSQWIAWMIVSMVSLVERGYTTLQQVRSQTDRLDALVRRDGMVKK